MLLRTLLSLYHQPRLAAFPEYRRAGRRLARIRPAVSAYRPYHPSSSASTRLASLRLLMALSMSGIFLKEGVAKVHRHCWIDSKNSTANQGGHTYGTGCISQCREASLLLTNIFDEYLLPACLWLWVPRQPVFAHHGFAATQEVHHQCDHGQAQD
jgi:hypothetical protein